MKKLEKFFEVITYPLQWIIGWIYGAVYHTPKLSVDPELAEKIKKYGVMHFGRSTHKDSILQKGLLAGRVKPLCPQEKNMVWLYLKDEENVEDYWNIVKTKGERKNYDTNYCFEGVTDEQIARMKVRGYDQAIVIVGDFSTPKMFSKPIPKTESQKIGIPEKVMQFLTKLFGMEKA